MTDKIKWQIKTFNELSIDELYDALKLRIDVFVVEQRCFYPDLDDKDRHPQTLHLYCYQNGLMTSYLRILPVGLSDENYPSIGRVIIAPHARGTGLGHTLMEQAILTCLKYFPNQDIKISAQEHLESYYNKHRFVKTSPMYLEDNIPHIDMIRKLLPQQ